MLWARAQDAALAIGDVLLTRFPRATRWAYPLVRWHDRFERRWEQRRRAYLIADRFRVPPEVIGLRRDPWPLRLWRWATGFYG